MKNSVSDSLVGSNSNQTITPPLPFAGLNWGDEAGLQCQSRNTKYMLDLVFHDNCQTENKSILNY